MNPVLGPVVKSHRGVRVELPSPAVKQVRAAIYCRKSTDENLHSDFNSLDAQREACQAYVASMKSEGWIALPERFEDEGFSEERRTARPCNRYSPTSSRDGSMRSWS